MKNYFIFNNKEFQDLGTQSSQRRRQKNIFWRWRFNSICGFTFRNKLSLRNKVYLSVTSRIECVLLEPLFPQFLRSIRFE